MNRSLVPVWLLAAIVLTPRAAVAEDNCLTPGYLARFNPILTTPQPCDLIHTADIRWGGHTKLLRAIKLRGVAMTSNPAFERRLDEIAASVGRALDRMGGELSLDDVTILFTDYVSPRTGTPDEGFDKGGYTASATSPGATRECPVSYYKDRVRSTGDDFVFVTAHEIFHCVQYLTWRDMPEQEWLTEASAEYFAFLATTGYTGGAPLVTDFDAEIPRQALSGMSYEAVVFYLWLGQKFGPARVREFTGTTRTIQSAIPPDLWIQFVTDYLDRTIHFPDGREIGSSPARAGTIAIAGDSRFDMPPAIPFTAQSFEFAFERGSTFRLTYAHQPPDFRSRWRKAEGGAWSPPLTDVSTCDGPHRYRVAWATTESTNAGGITIAARNAALGEELCSLLGMWTMTRPSVERTILVNEPRSTCTVQGGAIRLVFTGVLGGPRANLYTGSYVFDDVTYRCERPANAGGGWTLTRLTGTAAMYWQAAGGFLTVVNANSGAPFGTVHREIHTRVRHVPNARGEDGVSLPLTKDEPLSWVFVGPFLGGRYTLTSNQLQFSSPPMYPLGDYAFVFIRE